MISYYFDLSDKTCKEAVDVFENCLESVMTGEKCLKCRSNFYISQIDNLCYSNEEKGTFYKCEMTTMDGKQCFQCIDGYYTGLKDFKCTEAYVCLYSDDEHIFVVVQKLTKTFLYQLCISMCYIV